MKFAVVVLALVAATSAQTQYNPFANQYKQSQYTLGQYNPGQYNPGQYNPFRPNNNRYNQYSTPTPYRPFSFTTPAPIVTYAPSTIARPTPTIPAPVVVVPKISSSDASANIVQYNNEISPDGSYAYNYETDNGIAAQEQGTPRNLGGNPPAVPDVAQGSFSWTSPEGVPISISYIADENGYQPQGNAIPTPPAIPDLILRSLDYIARNSPKK